jgi:hypothetical protein
MHPVMDRERALWRGRATVATGLALLAGGLWLWWAARQSGHPLPMSGFGWLMIALGAVLGARQWASRRAVDPRAVARRVEAEHPGLDGRLLTALEPAVDRNDRVAVFLRRRVEEEVQAHWRRHRWEETYRRRERRWHRAAEWATGLALLVLTSLLASVNAPRAGDERSAQDEAGVAEVRVEVEPGDVDIEQGAKLVVQARFPDHAPRRVTLEWLEAGGDQVAGRFEMRQRLADPV